MGLQELEHVLFWQHVTGSGLQGLHDIAHQANMREDLLAEDLLFFEHAGLCKVLPLLSEHQVPFLRIRQVEQVRRFYQWQQFVEFQVKRTPELVQIFASSSRLHQLDQSCHVANSNMRQYLVGTWGGGRERPCFGSRNTR